MTSLWLKPTASVGRMEPWPQARDTIRSAFYVVTGTWWLSPKLAKRAKVENTNFDSQLDDGCGARDSNSWW